MTRRFPDFFENLEWNRVAGNSYQAVEGVPLNLRMPSRYYSVVGSNVLIVGITSNSSRPHWKTGGWATQVINFKPSSTSLFPAAVNTARYWIRLGTLTLCVFPQITTEWVLELSFPYWFQDVTVEAWRYDGQDLSEFDSLGTIEAKIDALP